MWISGSEHETERQRWLKTQNLTTHDIKTRITSRKSAELRLRHKSWVTRLIKHSLLNITDDDDIYTWWVMDDHEGDDANDDGDDGDLLPDVVSHQDLLDLGRDGQRIQLIRQSRHLVQTWTCELSSSSWWLLSKFCQHYHDGHLRRHHQHHRIRIQ